MLKLIVNGDDFGLCAAVNQGIRLAHDGGVLTSTTVMVNAAQPEEVLLASTENPRLGMGIHLNTTFGCPILPNHQVASLVDAEGKFLCPEQMPLVQVPELEKEWRAQIERFLSWGIKPDHLDSHHHVHAIPRFWPVVAQLARELDVPVRQINQEMKIYLQEQGIRTTDYFIETFYGPGVRLEELTHQLSCIHEGVVELMCHPAIAESSLAQISSYNDPRHRELGILTSLELRQWLMQEGIELINFTQY